MPNRELDIDGGFRVRNQGRIEKVDTRKAENEPTRFYHVTTVRLNVGDIITPGPGCSEVCLADSPIPHQTISRERVLPEKWWREETIEEGKWKKAWDGKWYCYEVEPVGVVRFEPEHDELRCAAAEVIRFVGDARSILKHQEEKSKKTIGSRVRDTRKIKRGGHRVVGRGGSFWRDAEAKAKKKES